jgi:hypothetical protein
MKGELKDGHLIFYDHSTTIAIKFVVFIHENKYQEYIVGCFIISAFVKFNKNVLFK